VKGCNLDPPTGCCLCDDNLLVKNRLKRYVRTRFELMFRAYAPAETFFEKMWKLPDIEEVK
jgi:hypothetical protein